MADDMPQCDCPRFRVGQLEDGSIEWRTVHTVLCPLVHDRELFIPGGRRAGKVAALEDARAAFNAAQCTGDHLTDALAYVQSAVGEIATTKADSRGITAAAKLEMVRVLPIELCVWVEVVCGRCSTVLPPLVNETAHRHRREDGRTVLTWHAECPVCSKVTTVDAIAPELGFATDESDTAQRT